MVPSSSGGRTAALAAANPPSQTGCLCWFVPWRRACLSGCGSVRLGSWTFAVGSRENREQGTPPDGLTTGEPALLTGFPTLLMSNCRGTPLGTFFSTVSAGAGTEVVAGGCRVQAEGGLRRQNHCECFGSGRHDSEQPQHKTPSDPSPVGNTVLGSDSLVGLVLVLTPAVSWLWDCQWR